MRHSSDILRQVWHERVEGKCVFHGMSGSNLRLPLDPSLDPFQTVRPKLYQLLDRLHELVQAGFHFTVREEHFGDVCVHDLLYILQWTRNDLDNSGIDFTSSYADACEYADCFQGSQLKQNFKYITEHLPGQKDDPTVHAHMTEDDWSLLSDVGAWIAQGSEEHRSIVLWVRRSCPAFDADPRCQPVGSFECFSGKVLAELRRRDLPCSHEAVRQVLPTEDEGFTVRMYQPLTEEYIVKIDEVTPEKVKKASGPRHVG